MSRRGLASLLVVGAVAIGLAACGDEGDSDTGSDETATAQFCSSLDNLSMALDDAEAATADMSETDLQEINSAIGGASDSANLAAQGAGVSTDDLQAAVQSLQPQLSAAEENPTQAGLQDLKSSLDPVAEQVAALEAANCQGEPDSGA